MHLLRSASFRRLTLVLIAAAIGAAGALVGALITAIVMRVGENAITAYATVFLALVTAVLATYTAALAWDTRQASVLSDRHHQEALNPILTLRNLNGIHEITVPHDSSASASSLTYAPEQHTLSVAAELWNIGNGPALRPQFRVRFFCSDGDRYFPSDNPEDWAMTRAVAIAGVETANAPLQYGDRPKLAWYGTTAKQQPVAFEMTVRYRNTFGGAGTLVIRQDDKGNYTSEEQPPQAISRALPTPSAP